MDPDGPGSADDGLFGAQVALEAARVVVIPVPWQATCSYGRGTREAPAGIREASLQVELADLEVGPAYEAGIAMLDLPDELASLDVALEAEALAVIEAGGRTATTEAAADRVDAACARMNAWVAARVDEALERGQLPVVVGGDHSVAYGAIRAVAARGALGVLHVDAHADLRVAYEGFAWSHASVFDNVLRDAPEVVRLVSIGLRDLGAAEMDRIAADPRVVALTDPIIGRTLSMGGSWTALCEQVVRQLPERVYVSVDVDGLDPSLCPTTGTPVPGGLSWHQMMELLRVLRESDRRVVGVDLVEVGPGRWDADVGARLLYKLIGSALG